MPNLNPKAKIIIICGVREIGKTYRSRIDVEKYLKAKKLRVCAFDTNTDDYTAYKTVPINKIKNLAFGEKARILPFKDDGTPLNTKEKKNAAIYLLQNFGNGLLIIEDSDNFATRASDQLNLVVLMFGLHTKV